MNKIKKLYTFITVGGCLILSLTSCDSFLDIQPVGKVIPNTLEEYRELITTAYGIRLTDRGMCDIRTEDITISKDEYDQNNFKNIERWVTNSTTGTELGWGYYYQNIYYANAIINKKDEITEGNETDINQLVGEAYIMRGYMHFLLVNLYGQPYTKEGAPSSKAIPLKLSLDLEEIPTRNTVEEVYTSILSDIENARKLINRKEWETGYNYRFNTLSIDALESRVRLYKGEWQEAYNAAERVLAQKSTLEDYNKGTDFQMPNFYNSVESITAYENVYDRSCINASLATPAFVRMFDEQDLRPKEYFGEADNENDGNYKIIKVKETTQYKCTFRTAELYLNAAEAAAQLGMLSEARSRLLELMEKRYTSAGYIQKKDEVNAMSQAELITEILNERARELAFEGHRWFDLRRTTRPELRKIIDGQTLVLSQNDERYTLNIPQKVIAANPNLMK
ncbi:RagB/SusD family nutrient uptake outer membrane protein [uncultured Bacteroides sp.]|uniref:RagB/SusD family nutrient uptake outer membrane protein n=1 Tax=uncultured Bacteroides sp. TaxID=162156 RepID=UPI0025FAE25A|nr:RagB/SusD family nutrient uptake outer membrane protein [uncultured Bacteroides sp.]